MKTILFATTNSRKLAEAQAACGTKGIAVAQLNVDIDEIQSNDFIDVARKKALVALAAAKRPVVVNDTAWSLPALKGFPGAYMKEVQYWFDALDFVKLTEGKDKSVCMTETICYADEHGEKIFSREYWGVIIDTPRGHGVSIEQIAAFDGKTIGEQRDAGKFLYDPKDYVWTDFAEWFATR